MTSRGDGCSWSQTDQSARRILGRYERRTAHSRHLYRQAQKVLPGGLGRNVFYHPPYPTFMASADGARVRDVDGNEYLDLLNNYTSIILGHNATEVTEQLRRVAAPLSWAAPHPWEVELATALTRRIPSVEQIRFTNSGTEATMFALRLARAARGRPLIARFEGGYHGMHDYALPSMAPDPAVAAPAESPRTVAPAGVPGQAAATVLVLPFNDWENTEGLIRKHAEELAAVIVEPVQGVAGMIPPQAGFLERLRAVTAALGILLIFDEVITFRLASGGAQEYFGVTPDLTTLGKIIGGGYAVGAFGGRREIMSLMDPSSPGYSVSHSGTFSGSPPTMAAGLAVMRALTPQRLLELNAVGDGFRKRLQEVLATSGMPATVTGVGSLFHIHMTDRPVRCYRDAAAAHRGLMKWFHLALLNEGIMLAPRGMGALSLATTVQDLEQALAGFRAAASAVV